MECDEGVIAVNRIIAFCFLVLLAGCGPGARGDDTPPETGGGTADASPGVYIRFEEDPETTGEREKMVSRQLLSRGISDQEVLKAMILVPRHLFMPAAVRNRAYEDRAIPIGDGQTISQPYIVALMTESLGLEEDFRVLEIGTGSGYQAAVLATLVGEVYTIEIREGLHRSASQTLAEIGFVNVKTKHADGYYGWEEYAPFDAIMITAAVDHIPPPLLRQLVDGGKLILPLGDPYGFQDLVLVKKRGLSFDLEFVTGVLFVPMTGQALR